MRSEPTDIPGSRADADGSALVPAFTFVLWVGCVAIGVTGLLSQPTALPPLPPPASQPAVQMVSVSLEAEPPPPSPEPQPQAVTAAVADDPSPLPSVPVAAAMSPAVAFAVPVAGPARVGTAADAVPVGPVVRQITYGVGVGRQPKPDYPDDARNAGQQGIVTVRMSIDTDGRVTRAWVVAPSPFPSLNQAALAAVRDTWHFTAGPPRLYDVPIEFHLNFGD